MAADDIYNFNAELEDGGNQRFQIVNRTEIYIFSTLYAHVCADKKVAKTKRKSIRMNDISDIQIKKEFGCDNCDRSFNSLAVC